MSTAWVFIFFLIKKRRSIIHLITPYSESLRAVYQEEVYYKNILYYKKHNWDKHNFNNLDINLVISNPSNPNTNKTQGRREGGGQRA